MGSYSWRVHADVPTQIISKKGITLLEAPLRDDNKWAVWGMRSTDIVYEPLLGGIILAPQFKPDDFQYPAEYYDVYPGDIGTEWVTVKDAWGEMGTYWLCRRDALVGTGDERWSAYLNPGVSTLEVDRGVYYDMYLLPLSGSPTSTRLGYVMFYPRVDINYGADDDDGITTYWGPFRIALWNDRMYVQQNENIEPTVPTGESDWTTVYEHPFKDTLDMATEFFSKRQRIWFLPVREDQLMVKADFLIDGGFVYHIDTEYTGFKVFPEGQAGVIVNRGGSVFLQIVPVKFATEGIFFSSIRQLSNVEEYTGSDVTATTTTSAPIAGGSIVGASVRTEFGTVYGAADVIDKYRYRIQIDSSDENYTPIVEEVKLTFEGEDVEKTFTPLYVEDDILDLEESMSEEDDALEVTMTLRDEDETYKSWTTRAALAFDYDWLDDEDVIHRAMLYMDDCEYDEDSPIIKVTARDGWKRLEEVRLGAAGKGDGKAYTDYIEELLIWAGWPEAQIDIYSEDAVTLPEAAPGDDSAWEPKPGVTLAEFIRQMHRDFAPEDRMYFTGDGVFTIVRGEDFTPASEKTFYWDHAAAEIGGDSFATIDEGSWREWTDIEDFRNLIYVVGMDTKKGPLVAYYADEDSATDPESDLYTGEWRMMLYINSGFRTQEVVNWVCRKLAIQYGRLRSRAEFSSHFFPEIRVGDFIVIDGHDVALWEVTGMKYNINSNTTYDDPEDPTTGRRVAHASYSIREYVEEAS